MMHPDTELTFISNEIGFGVVATKLIPKGTITWALDELDRALTPQQMDGMGRLFKQTLLKYTYRNNDGNYMLCWDIARFVNHSFNSNCITTAYDFELAIRDIQPGEELTDDYGYLNCTEPFDCLPEANTTRHRVLPDDLLHFHQEWDLKLLAAFHLFNQVHQPLAFLIDTNYSKKVYAVASGTEPMDSILNCYYSDDACKMSKKKSLLQQYSYLMEHP